MMTTQFGWRGANQCAHHADIIEPLVNELRRYDAQRVLDVGSGNGSLTYQLREAGFDVVGIEPDADGVELSRQWGGEFHQASVYDDPDPMLGDFDAVVCAEVIEHLFTPAAVPQLAAKLLSAGRPLVITTPYHGYWKNLALALSGSWDGHLEPLHDGGHIKFFSPDTLTELVEAEGFSVDTVMGAGRFRYLWRSMVLTAVRR